MSSSTQILIDATEAAQAGDVVRFRVAVNSYIRSGTLIQNYSNRSEIMEAAMQLSHPVELLEEVLPVCYLRTDLNTDLIFEISPHLWRAVQYNSLDKLQCLCRYFKATYQHCCFDGFRLLREAAGSETLLKWLCEHFWVSDVAARFYDNQLLLDVLLESNTAGADYLHQRYHYTPQDVHADSFRIVKKCCETGSLASLDWLREKGFFTTELAHGPTGIHCWAVAIMEDNLPVLEWLHRHFPLRTFQPVADQLHLYGWTMMSAPVRSFVDTHYLSVYDI